MPSDATGYLTKWDSPANELHFPTRRHFYYALVRTLQEGSEATTTHSARPPLPLELTIQILRDAECTVLSRLSCHLEEPIGDVFKGISPQTPLAKAGWPLPLINGKENDIWKDTGDLCNVVVWDANPKGGVWFSTSPLSPHNLANTHSIQLLTKTSYLGWIGDPNAASLSWFVVLIPSGRERLDRKEQVWSSHSSSRPASTMQRRVGYIFGPSHEIWQIAQTGDRIGVRACAWSGGWRNVATTGLLIIQEYFIPSFVPR